MNKLRDFIENKMSKSHIYQPVIIKVLLENGGNADKKTIAQNILNYDFSQVEYYEGITNNMVGHSLKKMNLFNRHWIKLNYRINLLIFYGLYFDLRLKNNINIRIRIW